MLKIRDDVDLKKLEKFGFKKIQQDKRINYIYTPHKSIEDFTGNMIVVNNDRNLFNYNCYLGEDRQIRFRLTTEATYDFERTMNVIYDLIQANLVVKE
mgnify:FL=1|jgi:hypothetical protein